MNDYPLDVAILDMLMPDIDGIQLLNTIRKYRDKKIPIIILSSSDTG